jgi:hypothetical protein
MSYSHQEIAMKTCFSVISRLNRRNCARPLALAVLAGLVGCAAPATGPVANADGTFSIRREAQNEGNPAPITAMATQDAEAHCLQMGKKFRGIAVKVSGISGKPVSEVLYACDKS